MCSWRIRAVLDLSFVEVLDAMRVQLKRKNFEQIPQLTSTRELDLTHKFDLVPDGFSGTKYAVMIGINYVGHSSGELVRLFWAVCRCVDGGVGTCSLDGFHAHVHAFPVLSFSFQRGCHNDVGNMVRLFKSRHFRMNNIPTHTTCASPTTFTEKIHYGCSRL